MKINFKTILGLIIIAFGLFIQISWFIFCFGSIFVGILLLIFAPSILFLPFNISIRIGLKVMGIESNSYKYSYRTSSNYNHHSSQNYSYSNPINDIDKYYETLESSKDDSFDTIKKNYRRLMKKYHYDSIVSQNLTDGEIKDAEEKTKQLNEAYSIIKEKLKGK